MNPAGKLELFRQMYDSGYLCSCDNWQVLDPEECPHEDTLLHEEDCSALSKFKEFFEGD